MQINKPFIISIIIALVLSVGVISILTTTQNNEDTQPIYEYDEYGSTSTEAAIKMQNNIDASIDVVMTNGSTSTSSVQVVTTYTLADVAIHVAVTDCWTVIDGNVYNLTQFIAEHPGGKQAITSLCGKDGSEAYHAKHGKGGRGQAAVFAKYKIGILK